MDEKKPLVDFGNGEDVTKGIIKVVGVGGGGCNAVDNMYEEGIANVTFAAINTDMQALGKTKVPVKVPIGKLGAGSNPEKARDDAQRHMEEIKYLFSDGTKMAFITAGMGGGTGTGAAPIIAGIAKQMGILTIGVVTIPFYFEKKDKIVKALKGVEEMRRNVDALLIINNERICDIYSDSDISVRNAFKYADKILSDAAKSISELITKNGTINLDFCDVETTMRHGGGAIMAIGRGSGDKRVEMAVIDALDSPLLYGCDIGKAHRILFNIYTNEDTKPLLVKEMKDIDAFMNALDPNIKVIWGVSNDDTLGEDAKITILATRFEENFKTEPTAMANAQSDDYYEQLISKLYKPYKPQGNTSSTIEETTVEMPPITVVMPNDTFGTTETPISSDDSAHFGMRESPNDNMASPMGQHGGEERTQEKGSLLERIKAMLAKGIDDIMTEDE